MELGADAMNQVRIRTRQIYQEYLRSHRDSTRQERWQHILDRLDTGLPHGLADHRGEQESRDEFNVLEKEYYE